MRLWPKSLKWRTILLTLLALVAIGVSVWWAFRFRVSNFVSQQLTLARLRGNDSPIVRDFAHGQFGPGTPLDDLLARHPAQHVVRYGRYTYVLYEPGVVVYVLAVDGRIRRANTTGEEWYTFLDTLSPAEHSANDLALGQWNTEMEFENHCAFGAVAGVAAVDNVPDVSMARYGN